MSPDAGRRCARGILALLGVLSVACGPVAPQGVELPDDEVVVLPSETEPPVDHAHERRVAALGPLAGLPPEQQRVFDPDAFDPLGAPRAGSWRDRVHERSQGFTDFVASHPNEVEPGRETLVLLPLGTFPTELVMDGDRMAAIRTPELYEMRGFLRTYFGLPVDVVTPMPLDGFELPTRYHSGQTQYHAPGLVDAFEPALPEHAYSMMLLVNRDLFVAPERDYGFGYATHAERVAVMSFARLDPLLDGSADGIAAEEGIRLRAYKLLAHEVAHTFGLRHCDHYECVMNGMADEVELDETPLHLCAVCLRKLLHVTGADPEARYRALAHWYAEFELEDEAQWVTQRLAAIDGESAVAVR